MAKKNAGNGKNEYKWLAHIQVYFSAEDIEQAEAWLTIREPDMETSVLNIVTNGTGIKVTHDDYHGSYQFTLQPKDKHSVYYGYTVGFSHIDLGRGMHITEYISEVLLPNQAVALPNNNAIADW